MGNHNKMTENYVQKIWVKNVVILGWFPFWQLFVFTVVYFCSDHFLTVLMANNNKMTEHDVSKDRVLKQVLSVHL